MRWASDFLPRRRSNGKGRENPAALSFIDFHGSVTMGSVTMGSVTESVTMGSVTMGSVTISTLCLTPTLSVYVVHIFLCIWEANLPPWTRRRIAVTLVSAITLV